MRLNFDQPSGSPLNVLRRAGYAFLRKDERTGELSFVKRVGGGDYPRFHIYAKQDARGAVEINLHLDQKKASYEGTTAHSGEYESEENKWLTHEAEIIRKKFSQS
ncbi:hypothetical protein KJ590_02990 [Patescibacteria group bacterium]|nr:hypothetical protein [Patescibacteria group bacterium]